MCNHKFPFTSQDIQHEHYPYSGLLSAHAIVYVLSDIQMQSSHTIQKQFMTNNLLVPGLKIHSLQYEHEHSEQYYPITIMVIKSYHVGVIVSSKKILSIINDTVITIMIKLSSTYILFFNKLPEMVFFLSFHYLVI